MDNNEYFALYTSCFNLTVQSSPSNPNAWAYLAKRAPTLSGKKFFLKYAHFLNSKKAERDYDYPNDFNVKPKVTFVLLEQALQYRMEKLAQTAHAAGIKIQLILCFPLSTHFVLNREFFDNIICVDDIFINFDKIVPTIKNFGSSLIHLFVGCSSNIYAIPWALQSPLPIVGDQYDACCAQYESWPHDKEALYNNIFYENVWLQHIDGLCLRTHYMKTKQLQAAYRPGIPVYYVPDPVRSNLCVRNLEHINANKLNILMDGLSAGVPVHSKAFEDVFSHAKLAGNIQFHVYRYDGSELSKYGDMIRVYPKVSQKMFSRLLKRCDAFMIPWCLDYIKESGYSTAMTKYSTRCTASDILEADIVNIVPDYFELIGKNAIKCNRGIIFSHKDQITPGFWKTLPHRVAQLRMTPSTPHRFLDTSLAPHLKSFYKRVIDKVTQRAL